MHLGLHEKPDPYSVRIFFSVYWIILVPHFCKVNGQKINLRRKVSCDALTYSPLHLLVSSTRKCRVEACRGTHERTMERTGSGLPVRAASSCHDRGRKRHISSGQTAAAPRMRDCVNLHSQPDWRCRLQLAHQALQVAAMVLTTKKNPISAATLGALLVEFEGVLSLPL